MIRIDRENRAASIAAAKAALTRAATPPRVKPAAPRPKPARTAAVTDCIHRGELTRTIGCATCKGSVQVKAYNCLTFGTETVIGKPQRSVSRTCTAQCSRYTPPLPAPPAIDAPRIVIPFETFRGRYAGRTAWVIGRGLTRWDKSQLAHIPGGEPVHFINAEIAHATKVRHRDVFFWFLDARFFQLVPASAGAVVMVPQGSSLSKPQKAHHLNQARRISFYRWGTKKADAPLTLTRDEVAREGRLYIHTGTIHPLIHFCWLTACAKVNFIGCDGINDAVTVKKLGANDVGYDPQTPDPTGARPGFGRRHWQYNSIRAEADRMLARLNLPAEYLGTPT